MVKKNKILIEERGNGVKGYGAFTRRIAREVLDVLKLDFPVELSILFVDDSVMQELNKQYRGIDSPTDVLAFPMLEGFEMTLPGEGNLHKLLGDVVISVDTAFRQATEFNSTVEVEIANLLCHGILHLIGYSDETPDMEKKMEHYAIEILCKIKTESMMDK